MAVGINLKNVGDRMSGFKDVVGHKNIIQYIGNAVTSDTVSHAYILNGERGSGKKLLANLFAMSLQCQNREADGDACGKCQSCKQAMNGNQPDIIRVVHEKPTTISVDKKHAGETAYAFLPHFASPAEMLTRFCSAMPVSTNCSGYVSANGVKEPLPLESLQSATIFLSVFAASINTSHIICLFAIFPITEVPPLLF